MISLNLLYLWQNFKHMKSQLINSAIKSIAKATIPALILVLTTSNIFAQQQSSYDFRTTGASQNTTLKGLFKSRTYYVDAVKITEIMEEYLYAQDISEDGKSVAINTFGSSESSYLWHQGELTNITGHIMTVPFGGYCYGDYNNTSIPGGPSTTAGKYSVQDNSWSFLGLFPGIPTATATSYSSIWGCSADGTVAAGLQFTAEWAAHAFIWTEANGYTDLNGALNGSRASGISGNGQVAYGWYNSNAGWSPMIWQGTTAIQLSPDSPGEVSAISYDGTKATGSTYTKAFVWNETDGMLTFGSAAHFPTIINNSGEVFGFQNVQPAARRAFYRDTEGNLKTFSEYALARGLSNANEWTFYSVNDVTSDGNKFTGAGKNPAGTDVTFIIDFENNDAVIDTDTPHFSLFPNPCSHYVNIGNSKPGSSIQIFNLQGQLIGNYTAKHHNTKIDISTLQRGAYMIQIIDGKDISTQKLLVE